ncbi:acetyl-CoA synthetase-like protein [Dendrothele bispora CBS 962.96]|uniref:Acetyl-CoA synthetase-like protein n=1 Tax=Dendrothele bispora (strain CBS 962.96) TaxID=1314807 RepID=A0A4S8LCU8_DENBC|nr:acetyl-CoA synthetase-like protein [Dendrothele bispora CBS 962.96]
MAFVNTPAFKSFKPTPESIPPPNAVLKLSVPPGIPVHIHPLNPLTFLLRASQIYPDKLALSAPEGPNPAFYSYAVWCVTQRVQNFAYALKKVGIKPGETVAVIAPNCPMIADALQGGLAARVILCPINTRLQHHEVEYILEHSQTRLILIDHEYLHLIKGTKIPFIVSNDTGRVGGDPYEVFLSEGRRFSRERGWEGLDVEGDENQGCLLCYTSGTTGRPKGVLTTLRGSYLAAIGNASDARMSSSSIYLWLLPMFHAAGWTYPWAITFCLASQITLRTVDFTKIWKHFLGSGVSCYCAAPTVQIGIINDPAARKPPQRISAIIAGAAPTAHLIGSLEKVGIEPVHVYGLTETYGPFTRSYTHPSWATMSLEERSKKMARQGHAFSTAAEVRVKQEKEEEEEGEERLVDVPKDGKTMGEIVTRGNLVMREYFRDPEATAKAFRGGYFRSGDLAVWYPDGAVAIMDRSKDIIISGGENASSLAIEQELASHPHVLEVSVVARSHPKWGERPMAFVTLHPQHVAKWRGEKGEKEFGEDLKKHARKRLPGFACPEWVRVVGELPKTSTGKILKTELRKVVAKL